MISVTSLWRNAGVGVGQVAVTSAVTAKRLALTKRAEYLADREAVRSAGAFEAPVAQIASFRRLKRR